MSVSDPVKEIYDELILRIREVSDFSDRVYKTVYEKERVVDYPCCYITVQKVTKGQGALNQEVWSVIFQTEIVNRTFAKGLPESLGELTNLVKKVEDKLKEDPSLGGRCNDSSVEEPTYRVSKEEGEVWLHAVMGIRALKLV